MGARLRIALHYRRQARMPAMVRLGAGWMAGSLLAMWLPGSPPAAMDIALGAGGVLALWAKRIIAAGCLAGLAMGLVARGAGLEDRLDPGIPVRDVQVVGVVDDLPRIQPHRRVLTLRVESPADLPRRIRLAWYEPETAPVPGVGERWRFTARLKPPRGLANPGGMDWPGWLLRTGIGATGYASGPGGGARLETGADRWLAFRGELAGRIRNIAPQAPEGAVLVALVTGFRQM
ncbi:MAG: ComEC/Rec2 family competence protein, partial [Gammaproteobacteria bacterium]